MKIPLFFMFLSIGSLYGQGLKFLDTLFYIEEFDIAMSFSSDTADFFVSKGSEKRTYTFSIHKRIKVLSFKEFDSLHVPLRYGFYCYDTLHGSLDTGIVASNLPYDDFVGTYYYKYVLLKEGWWTYYDKGVACGFVWYDKGREGNRAGKVD